MRAEFDAHAPGYDAGMDNPVKAMLGRDADQFLQVKLDWLLRRMPKLTTADASVRLLDYGCGTAALLRLMARQGLRPAFAGCDISVGMLEEAARTWPAEAGPAPELAQQDGARTPFAEGRFDLVVISAVLHHVPVAERPAVYAEIHRVLRPGGRIVVFEHNPLNPVTRYVVARTPIDANAILLRATEVEAGLAAAGFAPPETSYLMFAPPRVPLAGRLECLLGWLPLGAQYATTAARPA
jgi:SAM-dependent methyltransferase